MSRYPKKPVPLRTTDELVKEMYLTVPEGCQVARCCEAVMWKKLRRKLVRSKKNGTKRLIVTASLLDHLANLPEVEVKPPPKPSAAPTRTTEPTHGAAELPTPRRPPGRSRKRAEAEATA